LTDQKPNATGSETVPPSAPASANAEVRRASVARAAGRLDEAARIVEAVLDEAPRHSTALQLAGAVAYERGRYDEAVEILDRAVAAAPGRADLHNALGASHLALRHDRDAVRCFRRAVAIDAKFADAYYNLGCAHQAADRASDAAYAYRQALRISPDNFSINNNLGTIFQDLGEVEDAIAAFNRALEIKPESRTALRNLGRAYRQARDIDNALKCFEIALERDPADHEARFARARTLLHAGRYEEGFVDYESRWRLPDCPPREFEQPLWDGWPAPGRTILLHHEQGHGDTLQFVRYLPRVKERVKRLVVEAPLPLVRLLSMTGGVDQVVTDARADLEFDAYAPIGSLPRILGTTLDTVPTDIPYLRVDPALVEKWRGRIADGGLRVGLCWAGNPRQPADRHRSIPLAALAPLGGVRGATFYGLQLGAGRADLDDPPRGLPLVDLGAEITDFADTAAIMHHLDLVITVCTSVCHLAGGLGRPTWTLLNQTPDWRWGLDGEGSPWYPTMRLFRQRKIGQWTEVVERVRVELAAYSGRHR